MGNSKSGLPIFEIRKTTRLSNLGNGWGYEMTPAELAKKDEFYSIYWSEYNLVKESGSPELYDKIHNRNNYADI